MDLVWTLLYAPAAVAVAAVGTWVALDQAAEARRRSAETRHAPVVIDTDGRLVGQVIAVGTAQVPPRSHRARGRRSR